MVLLEGGLRVPERALGLVAADMTVAVGVELGEFLRRAT